MSSDSKAKRRFGSKSIYAAITIVIIAVAAIAAWQIYPMVQKPRSSSVAYVSLPPMNLTLVGANGVEKVLNASDIAQLTAFTGRGGFETSSGSIEDIGNYTGVSLALLCNLVGGISANDSVRITGSDGSSIVFSYNQTSGNGFVTYDPVSRAEVSNGGSLTLVLAYHENGENLTYDSGAPLRLVILGKGGLLTDEQYWIKWIAKIQIMPAIVYANLLPMNLTLVGADGTQKILHRSDIAQLTAFTGRGGLETSVGQIEDIGNYTGVRLITLCDLVGGISANDSVQITGSDGYSMVFSYNQTNGNGFVTYDPTTGAEVSNEGSLTLVLAYHENGANLTSDGPLRLVILGKGGLLTDGHYWIKWVAKIQILPAIVDWTLLLKDVSKVNSTRIFEYNITRSYFEAGETCSTYSHSFNYTDNNSNVWTGIPLWLLVASVENWNFSMSFNESLAQSNAYEVVVISQSGGNRTFTSSFVANSSSGMIVANELNGAVLPGKYWPLTLVGSAVPSDDMVVNVVEIELVFLGS